MISTEITKKLQSHAKTVGVSKFRNWLMKNGCGKLGYGCAAAIWIKIENLKKLRKFIHSTQCKNKYYL